MHLHTRGCARQGTKSAQPQRPFQPAPSRSVHPVVPCEQPVEAQPARRCVATNAVAGKEAGTSGRPSTPGYYFREPTAWPTDIQLPQHNLEANPVVDLVIAGKQLGSQRGMHFDALHFYRQRVGHAISHALVEPLTVVVLVCRLHLQLACDDAC